MADVKKIATRESYGNALVECFPDFPNMVVLDADLAAATKTGIFKKAHPERHIDCGIAECDMIGVAAGMAAAGMIPFASSFAMFAAGRAFEQVRNSVGYPHLNVKIGATHAGISVGEDGATHQCNEDIALMRTIPGMVVINPSDDVEAKAAVRAALEHDGPVYLRFGRLAVPVINDRPDYHFELGKGVTLRDGKDITIVASGLTVSESLKAAEELAAEGIDARVINIHTIKPIDGELIAKAAAETGKIVTVEEHSVIGGLGDAVIGAIAENPVPVYKIGGEDGATHQCNEDIALMRTIPGMVVINPSDDVEAKAAVRAALEHDGPVYLRFGRLAVPVINDRPDYRFELGKGVTLRDGKDITIVASGLTVSESLQAAEDLAAEGIDARVINIHTIKPIDAELVAKAAAETGKIVTVEEHSVIGGLGDAVIGAIAENPVPVYKIGVNDEFGKSGPATELIDLFGLTAPHIAKKVKEVLGK